MGRLTQRSFRRSAVSENNVGLRAEIPLGFSGAREDGNRYAAEFTSNDACESRPEAVL
jgi:hypothetical protein